jgi:hypothetical protein
VLWIHIGQTFGQTFQTSGFSPRVHAPVFLGSLTRQRRALRAPPPPPQRPIAALLLLFIPKNKKLNILYPGFELESPRRVCSLRGWFLGSIPGKGETKWCSKIIFLILFFSTPMINSRELHILISTVQIKFFMQKNILQQN